MGDEKEVLGCRNDISVDFRGNFARCGERPPSHCPCLRKHDTECDLAEISVKPLIAEGYVFSLAVEGRKLSKIDIQFSNYKTNAVTFYASRKITKVTIAAFKDTHSCGGPREVGDGWRILFSRVCPENLANCLQIKDVIKISTIF